jgi:hypothetical protein
LRYFDRAMTKGEVHKLNLEIDEIENALGFLDPTHWYESRQVEALDNRLAEISNLLDSSKSNSTGYLKLASSSDISSLSSRPLNSPL